MITPSALLLLLLLCRISSRSHTVSYVINDKPRLPRLPRLSRL